MGQAITVETITHIVPLADIRETIEQCGAREQRTRRLPAELVVVLCIAMNLFWELSISYVLVRLSKGLRLLGDVGIGELAGKISIGEARYRLGGKVLEMLFKRVCCPLATSDTEGVFTFGLRLVAIDGTTETVPAPANAVYFGRQTGRRGDSTFPQVRCVYLCECGTHAIFDAGFWPYSTSERVGGHRLLRSVETGMLVMWDRGFHEFDMVLGMRERGAQSLSRLLARWFARLSHSVDHALAWSRWRRRHQARARLCHYHRRTRLICDYLRL